MSALGARFLNRALEGETWARERLAAHAGRSFRIVVGPASETFHIAANGQLDAASGDPDLTLRISPLRLPSLMGEPQRWSEWVDADGDPALTATLSDLAQTLPWFVEAGFARMLGPVAGMRVASLGQRLLSFPDYAARRFADSVVGYARDEAPLGVSATECGSLAAESKALARRADALAERVDRLSGSSSRNKVS